MILYRWGVVRRFAGTQAHLMSRHLTRHAARRRISRYRQDWRDPYTFDVAPYHR